MRIIRFLPLLVLPLLGVSERATADKEEKAKKGGVETKSFEIPYKTTIPKHIVVRAKINGKGPFNFILDTGAPALYVHTRVAAKAGLKGDAGKWGTIDRLEIEGGLVNRKVRARVETPFQLEGMNGMGLAGMEVHGLMGYTFLAQYRMEIDFTRDKMTWTDLGHVPRLPPLKRGTGGGGQGGLEMMGSMMKTFGQLLGRRATPEVSLRGFYGMTLIDGDEYPKVAGILEKGPAGTAGLKPGDVITKVEGRSVTNVADLLRRAAPLAPGKSVNLTILRGDATKEITIPTGEGI